MFKVDRGGDSKHRGRYARLCVEIDLNKLLIPCLWVEDSWHMVKYENIHAFCQKVDKPRLRPMQAV